MSIPWVFVVAIGVGSQWLEIINGVRPKRPLVDVLVLAIMPLPSLLVFAGSVAMLQRRFRLLASFGAIAAAIPMCGPFFIFGIPFGVWALRAMNQTDFADESG